ncbi:helix-turn-helix domain-containing protein [Paenibacillus nasutitermitis]|uniref:HTH araC/xylS-type domain-containing protein n=1 Tax=Paenibacillus nasutitermitis TaxID=1652958 RepID=A0A916Z0C7_9BACL|nr:AraC family transcriptional regulator [Paenibacillus nasutitermitis]GGD69745.1 hypothetical protein GCM10010911_29500 [Paenibacillus nasutitermitis]
MSPSFAVTLHSHIYWNRKEVFALDKDRYPYWTLFAVEKGTFQYDIGGQKGTAAENELILCPPQVWFHRRALHPVSFHFVQFEWNSAESPLDDPTAEVRVRIADTLRLSTSFAYLRQLAALTDQRSHDWKTYMLTDMLNMAIFEREWAARQPKQLENGDDLMLEVRKELQARALGNLQMAELASEFGITPVQLTRRFRAAFGATPSGLLADIRLSQAVLLLKETALTMDEIAQRCGYDNGYYFSRVFEKHQRMRPSVFRRLNQV